MHSIINIIKKYGGLIVALNFLSLHHVVMAQQTAIENRIVAIVNNNMITGQMLNQHIANFKKQWRVQGYQLNIDDDTLRQAVLERLVMDKIQLQRARDIGLRLDAQQSQALWNSIAAGKNMSVDQLKDALRAQGVDTDAFIEELMQNTLLSQLRELEITPQTRVSEEEVNAFAQKFVGTDLAVTQTHVRHILLRKTDKNMDDATLQAQAEHLRQRIADGAAMAALANVYSHDGSYAQGGDLGWLNPGESVPELEAILPNLPEKQVALVKTGYGYHVVQVLGRRVQGLPAAQAREMIRAMIKEGKTETAYQLWLYHLRARAFVELKL